MSRSYRKFPSKPDYEYRYGIVDWGCIRSKVRQCIYRELHGAEYGDVVFPVRYREAVSNKLSSPAHHRYYFPISVFRGDYYTEIAHILNDFYDWFVSRGYRSNFIKRFNAIKQSDKSHSPPRTYRSRLRALCYDWIEYPRIKQTIKMWEGDPIDVLYYMIHHGVIEEAVRHNFKLFNKIGR
jgi:hypothetical protein